MLNNMKPSFRESCEKRLPFLRPFLHHLKTYPMPPVNWLWGLGACLLVGLFLMFISGIFLALNYHDTPIDAFHSLEEITRRLPSGWFIQSLHEGGASMFFLALYGHIGRALWYGSYKAPREFIWISGLLLLCLFMMTSFAGYILPWGQMSYWAGTVVIHAFHALPFIGDILTQMIFGEDHIGAIALHHLFIFHLLLGALSVGIILFHLLALHGVGSTDPAKDKPIKKEESLENSSRQGICDFHPYHTSKEGLVLCVFLFLYAILVFFLPDWLHKTENLIPANPLKTPTNISPEWYLAPYYAILKAIPSRLGGVFVALSSILVLFAFPWLDNSPRHNATYRPLLRYSFVLFFLSFITLIAAGLHEMTDFWLLLTRLSLGVYFIIPLIILPWNAKKERKKYQNNVIKGLFLLILSMSSLNAAQAEDMASIKRGFQVYQQICSACHAIQEAHYSDMSSFTSLSNLKSWAKSRQNADITAPIASPYPSEAAGRAVNGGDFPPDMSHLAGLIKGGPDYIEKMLQDYRNPPANMDMGVHNYYNPTALARHKHFRMPPPLHENALHYADNTNATIPQMAHDVTSFLKWVNNPHEAQRHFFGSFVLIYLGVMFILLFALRHHICRALPFKTAQKDASHDSAQK